MRAWPAFPMIRHRFHEAYGARLDSVFCDYMQRGEAEATGAALGFARAQADAPLFLERYLHAPVEELVAASLGRAVAREGIIEIGNLAAGHGLAMIALWCAAANDLGASGEIAVATLTAPLRRSFARIGVPIIALAPARESDAGPPPGKWGSYYAHDPQVCFGEIARGQRALMQFVARRRTSRAA